MCESDPMDRVEGWLLRSGRTLLLGFLLLAGVLLITLGLLLLQSPPASRQKIGQLDCYEIPNGGVSCKAVPF